MRLLAALSVSFVLLASAPVRADDMDSESQTRGYGHIFGYVLVVVAGGVILLGGIYVFKGMLAEIQRGKRTGISIMQETVLDEKDQKPKKPRALYLGEKVPDWKTANRGVATEAALKFLSKSDDWFEQKYLTRIAEKAFRAVKAAIEARSAKKIEDLVTAGCLEDLRSQMKGLRSDGEFRIFGNVEITDVMIVQVEAPSKVDKHTFTALVSAKSKDYIQDEKTRRTLRGDRNTYAYQEFLRFRRTKARWIVERIRPSGDMDTVLNAKNIMTHADLDRFAKQADEEYLREFDAR
jgi:predicted lipid-binding transport protein (Tim44 family)